MPVRSGLTACIQLQDYAHVCNRLVSEVASQCPLTLPVPQFSLSMSAWASVLYLVTFDYGEVTSHRPYDVILQLPVVAQQ